MDDPMTVRAFERPDDGKQNLEQLLGLGAPSLPFDPGERRVQIDTIEQFHHQKVSSIVSPTLSVDPDSGGPEQRSQGLGLAKHPFSRIRIACHLVAQDFHGHHFAVNEIQRTVDHPLSPGTDDGHDAIALAQHFADPLLEVGVTLGS
jgi:hypothetical protein